MFPYIQKEMNALNYQLHIYLIQVFNEYYASKQGTEPA